MTNNKYLLYTVQNGLTKRRCFIIIDFPFALQYTITTGQENQVELKANMIHSF